MEEVAGWATFRWQLVALAARQVAGIPSTLPEAREVQLVVALLIWLAAVAVLRGVLAAQVVLVVLEIVI